MSKSRASKLNIYRSAVSRQRSDVYKFKQKRSKKKGDCMAKAVLVMDMPEDCTMCKFWNAEDDECYATGVDEFSLNSEEAKPDWCPFRELPEKKELYLSINNEKGYCMGWNDCVDEILKTDGSRKE